MGIIANDVLEALQKKMNTRIKKKNNSAKFKVNIHITKGKSNGFLPGLGKESILKRTRDFLRIGKIKGSV